MYKPFLLLILLLTLCAPGECSAKPTRTLDASVSSEPDDIDRGVLGVRYAVGMDITRNTHVIVMDVVRGGPAAQAGLRKGDRIVTIDGEEVKSLSMKGVGPRMKGAPNTVLNLTVKRGLQTLEIRLVRGGLSALPDSGFKSRIKARVVDDERENQILGVCHSLKATHPDICKVVTEGKFVDAETVLERAVQADRNSLKLALLYALVLDQNGKPDHAQEIVENLVTGRPKWAEAWQALALLQEERGNREDAIVSLKKASLLVTDKQTEGVIRHHISELMEPVQK